MSLSTLVRALVPAASLLLVSAVTAMPNEDPGRLQFRGASFPVKEEAGTVTVVVKRQKGDHGEVTVEYETSAGSATAGEDYEETSGTLTWGDGDRSDKSFTINILDDDADEGQETFVVRLFDPTGGAVLGSVSQTTVRIKPSDREDDGSGGGGGGGGGGGEPGIVKLTAVSYPAYESTGEAVVTVERSENADGAASVDFSTLDGSAVAGDDYTTTQITVTWNDGELGPKNVTIPLIDDDSAENLETITLVLTNPSDNVTLGARDVASVLVVDDDGGDGSCVSDEETLCLQNGRFEVTGNWTDFDGNTGPFHFIPATDGAGLAWFFSDDNVEFLVKVLDGCFLNNHFWVFYAATTSVGFDLTVTDLETGAVSTYSNPVGSIPQATTDVTAFSSCS